MKDILLFSLYHFLDESGATSRKPEHLVFKMRGFLLRSQTLRKKEKDFMGLNIFPLALVAEVFIWNRVFSSDWQTEREIAAIFFVQL